jgi:hypothetical protein
MKKVILFLLLILFPLRLYALTETEVRTVIKNYAFFMYEEKKDDVVYVTPSKVKHYEINKGNYTQGNKFAMDCNAFVGFVIYNAFRIQSNAAGHVTSGELTESSCPALNGNDGWSSHSSYFGSKMYSLRQGETIQSAVKRYNLKDILKPGDLIAVVGYSSSSYDDETSKNKSTHIMIYVGNGKYIHNTGNGVSLNDLDQISFGNRVGSKFPDSKGNYGPHGSITVLSPKNYEGLSTDLLNGFRYPTGNGSFTVLNASSSSTPDNPQNPQHIVVVPLCQRKDISKLIKIILIIIKIIFIGVPIALMISLMFDLVAAVKGDNELDKVKPLIVNKCVSAVLIFLIPTFVNFIVNVVGVKLPINDCIELSHNPADQDYYVIDDGSSDSDDVPEEELGILQKDVYVVLNTKNIVSLYFSNKKETLNGIESGWVNTNGKKEIDFVLLPGEHYIYGKNNSGKIIEKSITIKSSDIVITNNKTDKKLLSTDLKTFLEKNGSSLEEFNDSIERSVYIAGGNTREGVSAASLALTQIFYEKYKVFIPYGSARIPTTTLGALSSWGSTDVTSLEKSGEFYNQGVHCGGFVTWAFTQGSYKMNSGIGSSKQLCGWGYGSIRSSKDGQRGQIGDVITFAKKCDESKHVALINYIDKEGYIYTEANARITMVNGTRTLLENIGVVTSYAKFGTNRWNSYIDMSNTYKNKSELKISNGFE